MSFSKEILEFKLKCNKARTLLMYMINNADSGHPGPSLSCVEICLTLYDCIMKHNPLDPKCEDRDRFILSKGHAAPTLYAILVLMGYIQENEIKTLRMADSRLQGHPDMTMLDCIEFSTGSLGKGISAGVGIAEALRLKARCRTTFTEKPVCSFGMPFVYTLIGDGELDEGIAKEAIAYAGAKKLANFILIVDNNGHQLSGKKEDILDTSPIENHFNHLQWHIVNRYKGGTDLNGHDYVHIRWAFDQVRLVHDRPSVIIFRTIKGKGVSFMEDDAVYHGAPPLDHELRTLTAKYNDRLKATTNISKNLGIFDIYENIISHRLVDLDKLSNTDLIVEDKLSPRDCVGKAIAKEADINDRIVSVFADLMSSCKGDYMYQKYPERCFEVGIAENLMNMLGGGLAKEGYIPFTNSFSVFQLEALGALRQIAYNNLNVKVMGSHGDPRLKDGGSHSEVEVISAIRGIPNWRLFWPSDGILSYMLVSHIAQIKGPCFMKYSRNKVSTIYNGKMHFGLKVNSDFNSDDLEKGYIILKEFSGRGKKRITIFASGDMVYDSLKAISCIGDFYDTDIRLVDYFRLKPANSDIIVESAKEGPLISAEASNIFGGLFSLLSEVTSLYHPVFILPVAVKDEFIKSGSYEELTKKHRIGHENIADAVIKVLNIKDRNNLL